MKLKNKLAQAMKIYFMLVTLITILIMVLGLLFDSDRTLSYQAYASPLIYAAIGVIPVFLPEPKKEAGVKTLILKRITEIAIIEIIILALAFLSDNIPTNKRGVVVGISCGIIVIYGLINLFSYLYEKKEAAILNENLAAYIDGRKAKE